MLGAFGSRWSLVTPTAIVLTIIGLGCGGSTVPADQNQDSPGDASQAGGLETDSQIQHLVIGEAWWGGWDLTLEDLVLGGTRAGEREAIIVGRVISATVNYDTSIIAHDLTGGETPPPDHPKAQPFITPNPSDPNTGEPFTHTTILIESVVDAPGLVAGDTIVVSQMGELKDGVAYEVRDDPLIMVGQVFLLFVTEARPGTWVSHPAARFEVDKKGQLQPASEIWENTPAALVLSGMTIESASAAVSAAVSEAKAADGTAAPSGQ